MKLGKERFIGNVVQINFLGIVIVDEQFGLH